MPRPIVLAHRGLSGGRTENTIPAFREAAKAGFDGVELDLQLTRDGRLVVVHDLDLDRVAGAPVLVAETDFDDLQRYPTPDGPVPLLADVFEELRAWQGLWNLEIKAVEALDATVRLLGQQPPKGPVVLTCMDATPLLDAAQRLPDIPRGLITLGWPDESDFSLAKDAGCAWIMADHEFLDETTAARITEDFKLGVWTVNEPARAKEMVGWGAELVMTDVAEVLAGLQR